MPLSRALPGILFLLLQHLRKNTNLVRSTSVSAQRQTLRDIERAPNFLHISIFELGGGKLLHDNQKTTHSHGQL